MPVLDTSFCVVNARVAAQRLGFVWIGLGLVVLAALYLSGRRPRLSNSGSYPTDEWRLVEEARP
jgi:hypothetical protein